MTYPAGTVTFDYPAFRTLAEAQAWALEVYGWAVDIQKRFNALQTQARIDEAAAIADLSLAAITDPADTPADADALRDDLVTNTIPSIEARLTSIQTAVNSMLTTLRTNNLVAT